MGAAKATGQWKVQAATSKIKVVTSRIGVVTITATAPVTGGTLTLARSQAELEFQVDINATHTRHPALDPEIHMIVMRESNGLLSYRGVSQLDGNRFRFAGHARAGKSAVPLVLVTRACEVNEPAFEMAITGTVTFSHLNLSVLRLPRITGLQVQIVGTLVMAGS